MRAATRAVAERAQDLDRQAGEAYKQGDFGRALELLDEARVIYPDMADVLTEHAIRAGKAQQEAEAAERALAPLTEVSKGAALEADRAASHAFSKGEYSRALTWLEAARQLDPDLPGLADHFARVRTAERAAVAEVSEPRDLAEVADTFADRLGPQARYERQRDANRVEPTEPCDAPKGNAHCGELGHLYPDGRRCDEHRPPQIDLGPEQPWTPAENSLATYVPADIEYRDLSHGNPEHECALPDKEIGQ
jgi:tetratricopeptide (TPR) repeat protein